MRTLWTSWAITALLLASPPARADGLIDSLPKNGSWVKHHIQFTETDNDDELDIKRAAGSLKLSSVGTETINKEKCRWVEIDMTLKQENRERSERVILKLLIPEKHLAKGKSPGKNIIRGWIRRQFGERKGTAKKIDPSKIEGWVKDGLLAGAQKEIGRSKAKAIRFQKGELNCTGITTSFNYTLEYEGEKKQIPGTARSWSHHSVPFGIAALVINTREFSGDLLELDFTLADFGTNAKSQLPDHK